MSKVPEHIWIQVYEHDDWTWSRERVGDLHAVDVEYIRADLVEDMRKILINSSYFYDSTDDVDRCKHCFRARPEGHADDCIIGRITL